VNSQVQEPCSSQPPGESRALSLPLTCAPPHNVHVCLASCGVLRVSRMLCDTNASVSGVYVHPALARKLGCVCMCVRVCVCVCFRMHAHVGGCVGTHSAESRERTHKTVPSLFSSLLHLSISLSLSLSLSLSTMTPPPPCLIMGSAGGGKGGGWGGDGGSFLF